MSHSALQSLDRRRIESPTALKRFRHLRPFISRRTLSSWVALATLGLGLTAVLSGSVARAAASYEALREFSVPPGSPLGEMVEGNDGFFYGTTSTGGTHGKGTIFRTDSDGAVATVIDFSGNGAQNKGASPAAGLILANDGNFYGTTATGGTSDLGTIFKLSPTGVLTTLVEFAGNGIGAKGALPYAALLEASDGNFYGTTSKGGAKGFGTIFRLTPGGILTTLVEFSGTAGSTRGALPYSGLAESPSGLLYGTTSKGGRTGNGTVFSVTTAGTLTTFTDFTDGVVSGGVAVKGACPYGTLVRANDGNFYGTTSQGGTKGFGTFFRLTPAGTLVTMLEFTGTAAGNLGTLPESGLLLASDGDLYGTTVSGGTKDFGTVFKVTTGGKLTTLVNFSGNTGSTLGRSVQSGLIEANSGKLYGVTFAGGESGTGTVFKLSKGGNFTHLASFTTVTPSTYYHSGLTLAPDGSYYGATSNNGVAGLGTLFRVGPDGTLKTLAEFTGNGSTNKGSLPYSTLTLGPNGHLYGSTVKGGAGDFGTLFEASTDGVVTTLVEFTGNGPANKGATPGSGVMLASDGNFYGTTNAGGANNFGTIFKLTPAGALTTLVSFTGNGASNKGSAPYATLVEGTDHNFYGSTSAGGSRDYGTLFKVTPAGVLTTLVEFLDDRTTNIGAYPQATLTPGNDGNFYGTTATGGKTGDGTVFKVTPDGALTTLAEFTGKIAPRLGTYPRAALVLGSDGNFYGTTGFGGTNNTGSVFRIAPGGTFAQLANFPAPTIANHGTYPQAGLTIGTDGNLYGTATSGGASQAGASFRLRIRALPVTEDASNVLSDFVLLNAQVKPGSLSTGVTFEYGTTTGYGSSTPIQTLGSSATPLLVTAQLSGLLPHTTYHYRVAMTDSTGTTYGPDETFTTEPQATEIISSGNSPSGEPGTTTVKSFGIPAVAATGTVAVTANLTTSTGADIGIVAGNPPAVLVRKAQPAPRPDGSTTLTRVFTSFSDPACDETGAIAFSAKILDGAKPGSGLWTNAGGTLHEVASVGGTVEGVPGATFKLLTSFALSGTGRVFYVGTIAGGGATVGSDTGLWCHDQTGNHLLLREGQPFNATTVTSFNVLNAVPGSPGQGRGYFDATSSVLVTLADKRQAILHFSVGNPADVVATTAATVPSLPANDVIKSLGIPTVSANNTAAFLVTMVPGTGDVTLANDQAILADSTTQDLPIVVRKGDSAPGASGTTFAALSHPVYNAQSVTSFVSTLAGTGVTALNNTGIWWTAPGGLQLVARTGSEPVGIPGATWGAFTSLGLPDGAGPAFVAKVNPGTAGKLLPLGVNATNNVGLWAIDSTGALNLVIRTGDTIHIGGAPKVVSLLSILPPVLGSPGQARSYNKSGDLVFRATFTDRTQSILRVHLP